MHSMLTCYKMITADTDIVEILWRAFHVNKI